MNNCNADTCTITTLVQGVEHGSTTVSLGIPPHHGTLAFPLELTSILTLMKLIFFSSVSCAYMHYEIYFLVFELYECNDSISCISCFILFITFVTLSLSNSFLVSIFIYIPFFFFILTLMDFWVVLLFMWNL